MKRQLAWAAMGIALAVPFGIASAQSGGSAATVRIYDATQIAMARYTVIKRLWVDNWQSAFDIRTHDTAAAATQALVEAAAALGADGVVNLACIPASSSFVSRPGYRCYGNAIRLKPQKSPAAG